MDGAVLQEDGTIVEIGTYQELSRKHPNVTVVGSGSEVMLPGFVNGHHHIGLTPVQLGSPDMPLELWFVAERENCRGVPESARPNMFWPQRWFLADELALRHPGHPHQPRRIDHGDASASDALDAATRALG
jgi:cytosine/adenosine deaminase-related metal-dependent hydrolase